MMRKTIATLSLVLATVVAASGCSTTQKTIAGAAVGGVSGAVVGDAVAGSGGAIVGGIGGAVAGGAIGRNL